MKTCRQCGATLADSARYCMQCGLATDEPVAASSIETAGFIPPGITGGFVLGILSSLPVISAGNYVCCMWAVAGGALAAWLLERQPAAGPRTLSYGDGAFVGVLSGLVGAIVATAFSIPLRLLIAESLREQQAAFEEMLDQYPEIEGPARELLLGLLSPEPSLATILATFFVNLIFFALFAMIGGILWVAIRQKKSNRK